MLFLGKTSRFFCLATFGSFFLCKKVINQVDFTFVLMLIYKCLKGGTKQTKRGYVKMQNANLVDDVFNNYGLRGVQVKNDGKGLGMYLYPFFEREMEQRISSVNLRHLGNFVFEVAMETVTGVKINVIVITTPGAEGFIRIKDAFEVVG